MSFQYILSGRLLKVGHCCSYEDSLYYGGKNDIISHTSMRCMLPRCSVEPNPNMPDLAAILVFHGTTGSIITIGFVPKLTLARENDDDLVAWQRAKGKHRRARRSSLPRIPCSSIHSMD